MSRKSFCSIVLTRLAIIGCSTIAACAPLNEPANSAQIPETAPPSAIAQASSPQVVANQASMQANNRSGTIKSTILSPAQMNAIYARKANPLLRYGLPLTGFISDHFMGSSKCANCHDLLTDGAGNNVSIADHWRSTMMANAAKDPLWLAKVTSEGDRNPAIRSVIETKCVTCHMPMAYTEAKKKGQETLLLDAGFLADTHPLHAAAMDGVSCTLCHQVQDQKLGTKESFSGKFTIDTTTQAPDRVIFGPYRKPMTETMQESVGYTPAFGEHINDSALCATCHTLYTPFLDASGKVAGEFPEQTPFLEWQHSEYATLENHRHEIGESPTKPTARLCQECHMPHTESGEVTIARYAPPGTEKKDHFSQHFFVGGNVPMLEMMRDNSASLGITAGDEAIDATIARTLTQLQSDSAAVSIGNAAIASDHLSFDVTVASTVGHKFPTGFPSRRAWLHLTVTDSRGAVLFESGKPLANGAIVGNDNDTDPDSYEPHYVSITQPDQVQIYETIMGNTDRQVTYTLLRSATYLKDNRLLPRGFDKATAPADIAVYGKAGEDADFVGGSDRVRYEIATAGAAADAFTVTVELLYSPLSFAFIQDLLLDDHLPQVKQFGRLSRKSNLMPIPVASVRAEIR